MFGEEISSLDITRHSYVIRYPSAKHLIEHFRSYFGPMRKAFEARDDTGQDALAQDLEELPSPGTPREMKR